MACGETVSKPLIVAAIDFGTTFSGYAFATKSDNEEDLSKIYCNVWQTAGAKSHLSLKTPTCILFDKNQKFSAFGSEAEEKYAELAHKKAHEDWYFFRRFKMQLYDKKGVIHRDFTLKDENEKRMQALKVISESIKYLRIHLENQVKSKCVYVKMDEIDWVLTVPAIWTETAKKFMREAANMASIPNSRLILALEPEAASIYCKNLPVDRTQSSSGKTTLDAFGPGTQYLVVDAGGGTIDITVQETKADGNIKQIYMANGGDWGGTKVDQAFEKFLVDLVGQDNMDKFKNEDTVDYLDLCRDFEIKKRSIRPDGTGKITFRIPVSLSEKFMENKGISLKDSFKSNKSISWSTDKLRVDSETAKQFFRKTCSEIICHLNSIFIKAPVSNTNIIILVGGFSESPMLQDAIRKAYPSKNLIIPEEAGLAVLKGAVQFGYDPKVIDERVSRFTFGVRTNKRFRPHTDPEEKKHIHDNVMYCRDRFGKHVERGEPIKVGIATNEKIYNPLHEDQRKVILPIYASTKVDPEYIDEEGSTLVGNFEIHMNDIRGGREREVVVGMYFGETDIKVEATLKSIGEEKPEKVEVRFPFK